jgi:hypothetical protein
VPDHVEGCHPRNDRRTSRQDQYNTRYCRVGHYSAYDQANYAQYIGEDHTQAQVECQWLLVGLSFVVADITLLQKPIHLSLFLAKVLLYPSISA